MIKKIFSAIIIILIGQFALNAQEVIYPYKLNYFNIALEGQNYKMAYMDVKPDLPQFKGTVILFHGKNFNGYYWKNVIDFLIADGFRVIIPDQIGWGRSDKPDIHYSFHLLAKNSAMLLDLLGINKVNIIGHSMGGMLAVRFSLMYPEMVVKLILENPIGLEDYKTFVPYRTLEEIYNGELNATYESYKKYQMTYYPEWRSEYEQYVQAQAESLSQSDFRQAALVNALTYLMIYEQPVCYEFKNLKIPVLLIIGQFDRTVVGKNLISDEEKNIRGQYPILGKLTKELIPGAELSELNDIGHIPHIQDIGLFRKEVEQFLK